MDTCPWKRFVLVGSRITWQWLKKGLAWIGAKKLKKKYNRGVSKDVYKIVTGDESWIYAYEPETKQKKNEKKTKDAVEAFKNHVLEVSQSEWKKCFDNWFERMQKYINLAVEYFQKQ